MIVLGQSFQRKPDVFEEAQKRLSHKIDHFGYIESRADYINLLCKADIVVSTALPEFYGISVIEAVRAGCFPILPNRLSYRELFPVKYLYEEGQLESKLENCLKDFRRLNQSAIRDMCDRFSWLELKNRYQEWFEG